MFRAVVCNEFVQHWDCAGTGAEAYSMATGCSQRIQHYIIGPTYLAVFHKSAGTDLYGHYHVQHVSNAMTLCRTANMHVGS
jgi:hypothetical protein